jgi:alpha-galactosidase
LLLVLVLLLSLAPAAGVAAEDRLSSIAATPYMGWNTYYGVGGVFDERTILSVARTLIDTIAARVPAHSAALFRVSPTA